MKKCLSIILVSSIFSWPLKSQDTIVTNPDSANIVTNDINNFWKAFDLLQKQRTTDDSLLIIKNVFVNAASEGLVQYMDAANCHEKEYLETIRKKKKQY